MRRAAQGVGRRLSSQPLVHVEEEVDLLKARQAEHLWHPMTQQRPWSAKERSPPAAVVSSAGSTLTRKDGTTLLDSIAGLWCVNVGYGREELAVAAYEAMRELPYHSPTLASPQQIDLAAKISELLRMDNAHTYFTSSGSEANEAAFKIARQFHAANRSDPAGALRYKILSRYRAYHGNTAGAMAATGQAERKIGFGPEAPGFVKVTAPYAYRKHPKLTDEEHVDEILKVLEETIIMEGAETVAAFVMEPFISGGGVLIPPHPKYIPGVRKICDKYGVLLIFDEVVSGFGRTGEMFGFHHFPDVTPDIATMAKGLSSGYSPLGAVSVSNAVFQKFHDSESALPPRLAHFRQVNTYGGHPVSCAVALKNIEILEREDLVDRAADVGSYFYDTLQSTLADHPLVGDIRHKGLLLGVELVTDKHTKAPLPEPLAAEIPKFAEFNHGIIIGRNGVTVPGLNNVLILAPPFVITHDECHAIANAIYHALEHVKDRALDVGKAGD